MKIFIITTKKDRSADLLYTHFLQNGLSSEIILYENLKYINNVIYNNTDGLIITQQDKVILRDPYNTGIDYSFFLKEILRKYTDTILLDSETLRSFPDYEDKLFQSSFFVQHFIPHPKTLYITHLNSHTMQALTFPLLMKKRYSSRARGNYVLKSLEELLLWMEKRKIEDYIVQEFIDIHYDIRVIVFRNEIIGAINRKVSLKANGKIKVAGDTVFELDKSLSDLILSAAQRLKADLVGMDIIIDSKGKPYVIEANISPQFNSFELITGINMSKKICELL